MISAQVINNMPFESALGGGGETIQDTRLRVCSRVGFSASDMSTMLAGAAWAVLAALPLARKRRGRQVLILAVAAIITFGLALTGGRTGYLAWGVIGLTLCLLKWRKSLLLLPVAVLLIPIVFPGAMARMFQGFGETNASGERVIDDYSVTSGRTRIWPYVFQEITESPFVGHGREAMSRTGLADRLMRELGESFPHPHNMYLEVLLDNGIIGAIPVVLFWGALLLCSLRLFGSSNALYTAVGGLGLSLMVAQLAAGVGSQHYFPRESTVGMWAAMFLGLRLQVEESRVQLDADSVDSLGDRLLQPEQVVTCGGLRQEGTAG